MSDEQGDIFKGVGVRVIPAEPGDYQVIKETLTRIGVTPRNQRILYQSCHIVRKDEQYIVAHFKELFALDGLPSTVSPDDILRRNAIVKLLAQWELVDIVDPSQVEQSMPLSGLKIIKHADKQDWQLVRKFNPANLRKFLEEGK